MKRETAALLFAFVFVAIVVMETNSGIGNYKVEAAIIKAQSEKVEHKTRPSKISNQNSVNTNSDNDFDFGRSENLLSKNFGVNTKDITEGDILILQNFLNIEGYLDQKYITGEFGPITDRAVREFQKASNIEPASGFVGELTRAKINEMISLASIN